MTGINTHKPVVSVVTAVRNGESCVARAAASIALQNLSDWEMVVVDDGSTDHTWDVLQALCGAEPRVRALRNEANLGRGASRNKAVDASGGTYVAVLDADDLALPGRLGVQVSWMQSSSSVCLLGGTALRVDTAQTALDTLVPPSSPALVHAALVDSMRMPFAHSTVIFRRDSFLLEGGYDSRLVRSQDVHFCRRLAFTSGVAAVADAVSAYTAPSIGESAQVRQKYLWSARAAWDFTRAHPTMRRLAGTARLALFSSLPGPLLCRLSGLGRKGGPLTPALLATWSEWVQSVQRWCASNSLPCFRSDTAS